MRKTNAVEGETLFKRVRILNDTVVNQIAAGEVVERPVSVVKELLENSLDAEASEVTVIVDNGGRSNIEVIDDGHGMTRQDALLAIERFGTSKITDITDLQAIATFGFRGEALPSIASVSRFKLCTKSQGRPIGNEMGNETGCEIVIEGGKVRAVRDVDLPMGTRVQVQQLFFNVPARRKFLRSERTEEGLIRGLVMNYSLVNPRVRFRYIADGAEVLSLSPATDFFQRVQQVKLVLKDAIRIETERAGTLIVRAYLSRPVDAVTGSNKLRIFVNRRLIRDPMLLRAIRDGYGTYLKPGQYPSGVLEIYLPSEEVDVNVHPQKSEVRFRSSQVIFQTIAEVVREQLNSLRTSTFASTFTGTFTSSPRIAVEPIVAEEAMAEQAVNATPKVTGGVFPFIPLQPQDAQLGKEKVLRPVFHHGRPRPVSNIEKSNTEQSNTEQTSGSTDQDGLTESRAPFVTADFDLSEYRFVGQVFDCYLIMEGSQRVAVVDMHAAHERVSFYRLKRDFMTGKKSQQLLLVPEIIDVPRELLDSIESALPVLERLGFSCELFGEDSLVVRSVPLLLAGKNIVALFRELFAIPEWNLPESHGWDWEISRRFDMIIARLACHASVRSGRALERDEVYHLLASLQEAEVSALCPHGRPVVWGLTRYEMEKMFGRS